MHTGAGFSSYNDRDIAASAEFSKALSCLSGRHLCIPMQSMRNEGQSYFTQSCVNPGTHPTDPAEVKVFLHRIRRAVLMLKLKAPLIHGPLRNDGGGRNNAEVGGNYNATPKYPNQSKPPSPSRTRGSTYPTHSKFSYSYFVSDPLFQYLN